MRKVKDEPKTCSVMNLDSNLSRKNKKIFGTLKNSVVIEDSISVVGDLGKKTCSWGKEEFFQKLNLNSTTLANANNKAEWQFYIDEYKNVLVPSVKIDDSVFQATVHLDNCAFDDVKTVEKPTYPECKRPTSKKKSSKKKTTKAKKTAQSTKKKVQ